MCRGAIGILIAATLAAPADDMRRVEQALQAVIAKAEPAVACLFVYRPERQSSDARGRRPIDPDERQSVPDFYASGVVIDPQGKILTNYHFIREAAGGGDPSRVRIRFRLPRGGDGPPREGVATVYAADAKSDLAVLKFDPPRGLLPTIPLGRGEDLKKGSLVVSLGHPYAAGFRDGSPSASWGIVSNLRRRQPGSPNETDRARLPLHHFGTLIQTDVRLQLGTSGGALLDAEGKLVGLTTAQAALTGVDAPGGYAIPLDDILRRIVEVLLRGEEVEYGFLGISTRLDATRFLQPGEGVEIDRVIANAPAAGMLRAGDVVLAVNGRPLREYDDLFLNLAAGLAGRSVALTVRRDGREFVTDVPLVKAQVGDIDPTTRRLKDEFATIATNRPRDWYGLRVDYSSCKLSDSIRRGVLVREVTGQARNAPLTPYEDIITHVNDQEVLSPADFARVAGPAVRQGDSLKLTVAGEPPRTVTLP
jgi:S1-C subfamily serine protease